MDPYFGCVDLAAESLLGTRAFSPNVSDIAHGEYQMITLSYSENQLRRQNQLTRAAIRCQGYLVGSNTRRPIEPVEVTAFHGERSRLLLPPTEIVDESDAEHISGTIAEILSFRPEPRNFQAEVSGIIEELMINAIQHSQSGKPHRGIAKAKNRRKTLFCNAGIQ